ncbi:MAG: DUF1800 family protein [Phenylobacterium sp.]|nr:DUF1800 family protein [Phenylobacterium sp.]
MGPLFRAFARWPGPVAAVCVAASLAACSGSDAPDAAKAPRAADGLVVERLPTAPEASRFLTQATYGPTDATISQLRASGYAKWLDQQMALPSRSHLEETTQRIAQRKTNFNPQDFIYSYWDQAITAPDQLRQRMKLALSEIFVISLVDSSIQAQGAASYYDMLGDDSFGNFRTLLEDVTLHPMMGIYLTWLGNQKEDPATGRNPDENFAREIMQLMTIGLYHLNLDGTLKLDKAGQPIPTYSADDIGGLSRVLTGYSYYSPNPSRVTFRGGLRDTEAWTHAMIPYPTYHSTGEKAFLGVVISASDTPDPQGDLKIALDTLFNHPNVGPFIGKQLIQRLVTSNPSPAYVGRVAAVFNDNGKGVRGDMAAVVRAILLDPEARDEAIAQDPDFGKVREPIVRLANWARAFNATSKSGQWLIPSTSANTSLGQAPLMSPSVFNFYRPGYSPPGTRLSADGRVAPEFQIVDEVTVAGYLNTMQATIAFGIGGAHDVKSDYATELDLARDPGALADRLNLLLLSGRMSSQLRRQIIEAVEDVRLPPNAAEPKATNALRGRVWVGIYLTMASPEYLVQR